MKRITASATRRLACTYWLSDDVVFPVEVESEAAAEGTRVHGLIEQDVISRQDDPVDPAVLVARWYRSRHCEGHPIAPEQAFGWDGTRARFIGTGRESYSTAPTCHVTGTVDLLVRLTARRWRVVDWKNGERGARNAADQLRTLAALVLAAIGGDECEMHAVYVGPGATGEPVDYGTLSAMEADAHLATLDDLRPGPPVPGDHCGESYCPLRGTCPAYSEAAALVPVSALTSRRNPLTTPIDDVETARAAVELLGMVDDVLKAKKEELKRYVAASHEGRLDLGDGRAYRRTERTRKGAVKGEEALALAEQLGATQEQLAALLTPSATYDVWTTVGKRSA
jgi:hypothetical protein